MAVRNVGNQAQRQPPNLAQSSQNLAQQLQAGGFLKPGMDANSVVKNILSHLRVLGFSPEKTASLMQQFSQSMTSVQRAYNLAVTGKLDPPTATVLRQMGVTSENPGILNVRDGFERPATAQKANPARSTVQQTQQAKTEQNPPPPPQLGLSGAASPGAGGGGKGLGDMLSNLVAALRSTFGGAETSSQTQSTVNTSQPESQVAAQSKSQSQVTEQARSTSLTAQQDPHGRGVSEGKGDPNAVRGTAKTAGTKGGAIGDGDEESGARQQTGEDDGSGDEDEAGTEKETGNATSGDDDLAAQERGHSTLDDDSDDGAGYYEIPALSKQIVEGLQTIRRDADDATRATTYTWDVTFYRPGVYGAGQKAEELLHLVVDKATSFDPVWETTRSKLQAFLGRVEPGADRLDQYDFEAALKRARVDD